MSGHTILVVADEPITRNLIVHALTAHGHRVYEADTEMEAELICRALGAGALDLVIADHHLASTTGRAVVERVMACCPGVKVVQIADMPFQAMRDQNALVTEGGFLQRPFTPQQLLEAVENALEPRTQ